MSKMIMKKAHFHSNHLVSIVNKAQIASLQGKSVVFTSACLRSGLNTAKLSKRQIQVSIYNVVSRSK